MEYFPDHLKTQELCDKAFDKNPWTLVNIPDQFITQEMCDKDVMKHGEIIENGGDDEFREWFKGCKVRKSQKT